ncbi:t-SNARE [Trichophaea hybrida]|nr:t-SNARE [Trichophaea hybrida]
MSNPYGSSSLPLLPQTGETPLALQHFLNEISNFTTQLQTFSAQINDVSSLHDAALRSTESATGYTSGASARLEAAVAECSSQAKALKDFLKALEVDVLLTSRDGDYAESRTKAGQFEKAKKDLQAAVREFENTERVYRNRYNELLARQYRIVNPSATAEEIEHAVSSGETQVFSQALLNSNRSASAKSVATAVRERQQDIARIEKTLEELVLLFEQMEEQVMLAEPLTEKVDESVLHVSDDLEKSVGHLDKGVDSAKGVRRKKWWCLLIGVMILVVIIIIIVIILTMRKTQNKATNPKPPRRLLM